MSTDLTTIVFAIAAFVALLAIIQFVLAVLHDRAVTAAGPIEELAVYDARIEQKRTLLTDVEEELEKRREAIAHVADVQAEVDALTNQRENLLAEWASLEERRQEVLAVREETEAAMTERQTVEAELSEKRVEYNSIQERLEKAETLVQRLEALTKEETELHAKIDGLRETLRRLEEAEDRVRELDERARDLETENARKEGLLAARDAEAADANARLDDLRSRLAQLEGDTQNTRTERAALEVEIGRQKGELNALGETRSTMEARLAFLEGAIARAEGAAAGPTGAQDASPLKELVERPEVIVQLAQLSPPTAAIAEADALHAVEQRMRAFGLEYPQRTLRAFHTAMKVNESTQMAVLAGISGTGKSQLPRQYAAAMGIGFLQVPVQPRWDSPQDLMGFYNYIEGRFRPTDMAKALWALDPLNNPDDALEDRMMMVLLDEMNLARVEYYFSDFLSRLESRPSPANVSDKSQRKDAEIELEIPKLDHPPRIFPGYNLLFAGTMNEDESTQSLSDKVVDRANILRFAAPRQIHSGTAQGNAPQQTALSQTNWNRWLRQVSLVEGERELMDGLDQMVEIMKGFGRPFGHRLGRAIMAYAANYPRLEGVEPIRTALADQIEMRLLPKLRGVELEEAEAQFSDLERFAERDLGDAALADAIGNSRRLAESTGQFVWTGVAR